jgi:purine-nucleoside phosphorylase
MTILVPRGAEAWAVRRAHTIHRVVAIPAGPAAAALPPLEADDIVLVLGLCGALRERRTGDVVIYRGIAPDPDIAPERDLAADRGIMGADPCPSSIAYAFDAALAESLGACLTASGIAVHSAIACTTKHVVTTRSERRALAERLDADVVDMEGADLAAALALRGVRFAMVRVVSDDASRDLPALAGAIRSDGRVDGARIALAFARSPWSALAFVRDVRTALARLTTVTRALAVTGALTQA